MFRGVFYLWESKFTINLWRNTNFGVGLLRLQVMWSENGGLTLWSPLNDLNELHLFVHFSLSVRVLSGWLPLTVQLSAIAVHHSWCYSPWKFKGHALTSQETWKTETRYACLTHTQTAQLEGSLGWSDFELVCDLEAETHSAECVKSAPHQPKNRHCIFS